MAINSQGRIPCLTDGDLVLTESLGIVLYLATVCGGDLGPRDRAEEALMVQWALHAASGIEGPALEIQYITGSGAAETPEGQATIAVAAEKLRRPLARLEGHLTGRDWMMGSRFTAADINTAECLRYAQAHPTLIGEFPALAAWLARAVRRARPSARCGPGTRRSLPEAALSKKQLRGLAVPEHRAEALGSWIGETPGRSAPRRQSRRRSDAEARPSRPD